MRKTLPCFMSAVAMAVGAGPVLAQFTPMRTANTYVTGMSADGSVVAGVWGSEGPAWRWTSATGVVDIGSISQTVGVSRDGRTIVGTARADNGFGHAATWQSGKQWVTLPPPEDWRELDGKVTIGYDVSADGSVIVGLAYLKPSRTEGFRYHATTGTVPLGTLTRGRSRGSVVSGDGRVSAGWDDLTGTGSGRGFWFGTVWWEGMQRLLHPYNGIGQVEGSNDVGSILVGKGHPLAWTHAYRYTSWDGNVEDLGAIRRGPGGSGPGVGGGPADLEDTSVALSVSDDGNVVVGTSGYQPPTEAFVWTPETKIIKLHDYLTSKGITGHERWTLLTAVSVSPDGKIIAGTGINNVAQRIEGFVVRLP